MEHRELGNTGIAVSSVCAGCMMLAGGEFWGSQEEADAIEAIHASFDAGINFFDTAEAYEDGYSEQLVGKALSDRRDKVIIGSKVRADNLKPEDVRRSCEATLKRLATDYVDLYQIHWPNWQIPLEETIGALEALKSEGKIRAYGVSNFGKQDLTEALGKGEIVSGQLPYSLLWRAVEFDVQPVCVERNISILCYCPMAQGLLTGKFATPDDVPVGRARFRVFSKDRQMARHTEPGCEAEAFEAIAEIRKIAEGLGRPMAEVALAWVLAQPRVTAVIAGCRNRRQAEANAHAADLKLPDDAIQQLTQATELVKQKIGRNIDMWQTDSRIR